jgi:hypothetical protein
VNSIRRLRRTFARWVSSPGRAEPQARQPSGQVGRPGRNGVAARFIQHVTADAGVVAAQHRPAPPTTNSRRGSGSAATAAKRCAAHGIGPAASNWDPRSDHAIPFDG